MLFVLLYHLVFEVQWEVEITFEKRSNLYLRLLHYRTRWPSTSEIMTCAERVNCVT